MPVGQGVTILDMAAGNRPIVMKGTLEVIADLNPLSDLLKFKSVDGTKVTVPRVNADMQPPALYRNINSDGKFVSGTLEYVNETLKVLYEPIKIDKLILMDKTGLVRPEQNIEWAADAMQLEITNAFINGDGATVFNTDGSNLPAEEPKGMRYRLQNATTEGMDPDTYTLGTTGSAIDLSGTITASIAYDAMDSLKELQTLTLANTLFCNFRAATKIRRAAVLTGALDTTQDNLFRPWKQIFGMRLIETQIKAPARRRRNTTTSANWTIPRQDTSGNDSVTSGGYTTYYVANVSEGHVEGLTFGGMMQEGPTKLPPPTSAVAYELQFAFGFLVNGWSDIGGLYSVKIY
jgi:hypothetical protein